MNASIFEQLLSKIIEVLSSAELNVKIFRGRKDRFSSNELPAINICRKTSEQEAFADAVDKQTYNFDVEIITNDSDYETALDELHGLIDQALIFNQDINKLVRGLRWINTEIDAESTDEIRGRLVVTYTARALI